MNTTRWCAMALGAALALVGCGGGDDDGGTGDIDQYELLDIARCAPSAGSFSAVIDNPYLPLAVGAERVLEGDDEGTAVRVELEVLDQTEDIAGVTTRVVEVSEYEDGALIEISHDFYAQAADGTVCYFGEDVDVYEDGEVVGHTGQWRAGDGTNVPGIIMPGAPQAHTRFAQESAPGVAEDMSAIVAVGESVTVPAGSFDDAVWAVDWNPLEGDTGADGEDKYYVRGIGLVFDNGVALTSYE